MNSLQIKIDFANRSFRDVADQDYISARINCRANLREPFLWSSLQAIEKYLKAILLYNNISSKGIGHRLIDALDLAEDIDDIRFSVPERAKEFIAYLDSYGTNRYLEFSTYLKDNALFDLDFSIWHIRKYCFFMRQELKKNDGTVINLLQANISKILNEKFENNPHKYKIQGGLLEKIINEKNEAYRHLIWHNIFYGRNKKNIIKNHKIHISSVNPTLTMHPEGFRILDELVQFSRSIRRLYNQ